MSGGGGSPGAGGEKGGEGGSGGEGGGRGAPTQSMRRYAVWLSPQLSAVAGR